MHQNWVHLTSTQPPDPIQSVIDKSPQEVVSSGSGVTEPAKKQLVNNRCNSNNDHGLSWGLKHANSSESSHRDGDGFSKVSHILNPVCSQSEEKSRLALEKSDSVTHVEGKFQKCGIDDSDFSITDLAIHRPDYFRPAFCRESYNQTIHHPESYGGTNQHPKSYVGTTTCPESYVGTASRSESSVRTTPHPETYIGTASHLESYIGTASRPVSYFGTASRSESSVRTPSHPETYIGTASHLESYVETVSYPESYVGTATCLESYVDTATCPESYVGTASHPESYAGTTFSPRSYVGYAHHPTPNAGTTYHQESYVETANHLNSYVGATNHTDPYVGTTYCQKPNVGTAQRSPVCFVGGTHHPESIVGRDGTNTDGVMHIPNKHMEEFVPEGVKGFIRCALGDKGPRNVLDKVARDLHLAERSQADAPIKVEPRNKTFSRPSVNSELETALPCCLQHSSLSAHVISGTITKDLQQQTLGEKDREMAVRNYRQVTMPTNTRNAFSTEEIYKQAYGTHAQQIPHQQNPHQENSRGTKSGIWFGNTYEQQHSSNVKELARAFESAQSKYQNNYSPKYPMNFSSPTSHLIKPDELQFPMKPNTPGGLNSSLHPQFDRQWYQSSNTRPPAQFTSNSSNMQMYYTSNLPKNSNPAYQTRLRSYQISSPPNAKTYGVPGFINGIPLNLPPPTLPHGNSRMQQLPSHPPHHAPPYSLSSLPPNPPHYRPLSPRRNCETKSGTSLPQSSQISSAPMKTPGQQIQVPFSPVLLPTHSKDEPNKCSLGSISCSDNSSPAVSQPIPNKEYQQFNLQRYFASIQDYSKFVNRSSSDLLVNSSSCVPGSSGEVLVSSSRSSQNDFSESELVEACMDVTETTNRKLDIDDQVNHFGDFAAKEDHISTPSGDRVKYCEKCKSPNELSLNWCIICGESMQHSIPRNPKKKLQQGISDEKIATNAEVKRNFKYKMHSKQSAKHKENVSPQYDSVESGRGLSTPVSPMEHQLQQNNSSELKENGWKSSTKWQERDKGPEHINYNSSDGRKKDVYRRDAYLCDNENVSHFEDFNNPAVVNYNFDQSENTFYKLGNFNRIIDNNCISPAKISVYNQGELFFGDKQSYTPGINQDYIPDNTLEMRPAYLPKATQLPSLASKNELAIPEVPLSQFKNVTGGDIGTSPVQQTGSKSKNVQTKASRSEKKMTNGEMVDIEIFGYDEVHKSKSQVPQKMCVPTLNLACSSDEEEDNDVEVKEENQNGTTSDINMSLNGASRSNPNSTDPAKTHADLQNPSKDDRRITTNSKSSISTAPKQQPMKTVLASPPRSCPKTSQVPLHQKNQDKAIPHFQRHWARSSTAWSSYNPRELNTRSSVNNSLARGESHRRGGSWTRGFPQIKPVNQDAGGDLDRSGTQTIQRPSSAASRHRRTTSETTQRPASASFISSNNRRQVQPQVNPPSIDQVKPPTTSHGNNREKGIKNRQTVAPSGVQTDTSMDLRSRSVEPASKTSQNLQDGSTSSVLMTSKASPPPGSADSKEVSSDDPSPRLLCAQFHRLPQEEVHTDRLHVSAKSAYDKFQEMTPRIAVGQLSCWQCLPDEIWLYVLNFLSHGDLKNVMLSSKYFNRLANDETLWRYITVKPRYSMTDKSLATIASHRPISLAMVKCQGLNLSLDGLTDFFKSTQSRLQELNICGCSQGSLVGTVVLTVAARYCQQLTHLDASYCLINDEALIAISDCAEKLESVCVNGFQSMSDSALLILLKKHGKSLRTLELYACFSLSATALDNIGFYCTSLRRLCLGSCNKLTDSAMTALSLSLSRIQELDLRGCKNLKNDCIRMIVRNCPRIQTLVLANCHYLSDTSLEEIATHLKETLRVLDVCGCNSMSDSGVITLAKNCHNLTSLDISSTRCSSISVQQLAESKCNQQLETVKLSFLSGLTEVCLLNLIQQCARLRSVHVFGCSSLKNLAKLQLANPKLSLEGDCSNSLS